MCPSSWRAEQQDRPDLRVVSASGSRIRFSDGQDALCGTSGLWNANLGYGNPAIAEAVAKAQRGAGSLPLSQSRCEREYATRAAEALIEVSGAEHYGGVMYSTSGAAASELVIKLVQQYHVLHDAPERRVVVVLRGSDCGLTSGGLALTDSWLGQQRHEVDQCLIRYVDPKDIDDLERLLNQQAEQVAVVVAEPVAARGGLPLDEQRLAELLRLRDTWGFLLVADELASGFGRTGSSFGSQRWPQQPDLLVASNGLTNGTCAAAAVLMSRRLTSAFSATGAVLRCSETQADALQACAAILATVSEMHRIDAVRRAQELSTQLDRALAALANDHPVVSGSAGLGCVRAVSLRTPDGGRLPDREVLSVVKAIRSAGAIVHPGPHCIQLMPALTYTTGELAELMIRIERGLDIHIGRAAPLE